MNASHGEETVFAEVLRLPPDERAAYLAQATYGNAELRRRVESLLGSYEAGDFLEQAAAPEFRPALHRTLPLTEKPGDTIGRYKLLQQIGEGGCGVVYLAEQTEPVRRRVALKILKLGMDTKSVIARFEAERQALAMMDHPNIAKVFDAGATEAGRPFFVMELVRGMKLTEYCDEAKLSTRARLDLFIQVCQAVQHAHQKGIIHRDIKPSNILVTVNDGVPVPKVIDFGIAKATSGQQLTDKTLFTAFDQFIGTPAYMSPEQAVLTSLDIDTRSDIYALGVLLYELLTGRTPFDAKELLAIGLDEMRRTIREREPPRPSNRVSTLPGQELSTAAQRRGLEPPKLVSELRGDLDWIVMKALEKDRARRYATANGFAADLLRHLNHEPVIACPPSTAYRLRKLIQRNRLAFTATAAVLAALVIGLGAATWMFFRERNARQEQAQLRQEAQAAQQRETALRLEAEAARTNEARLRLQAQAGEQKAGTEAAKSRMVAQFLKDMLQGIRPSIALGRDTTLLREMVDQTADRVSRDLANQPEVQAELQAIIGEVYRALALWKQAEMMQRQALATRRKSLGRDHPEVARALNDLALVIWAEGEGRGIERFRDERFALPGGFPNDYQPADPASVPVEVREAEPWHRQALAIRRKALGDEHLETTESLNNLAVVLRRQGGLAEAEALHREALATRTKILGGDGLLIATSLHNLGVVLRDRGELAEAEPLLRQALAIRRKLLGTAHLDVAATVRNLTDVLQRQTNPAAIRSLFHDELANAVSRAPNHPRLNSDPVCQILDALLAHQQFAFADRLKDELLTPAIQREPANVGLIRDRGELHARRGRWKEAAADLAKVIELDPDNHEPWFLLAKLLLRTGSIETYCRHCHEMLVRFGATSLPVVAGRTASACLLLPVSGSDFELAVELANTAVVAGVNHPNLPAYQRTKGLAEYRLGRYALAEDWLRKSLGHGDWVLTRLILAMTCHQLQKTDEARYALRDAVSQAEGSWLDPGSGDFGEHWVDVLDYQILSNEAKALIGDGGWDDRGRFILLSAAEKLRREGKLAEAEAAYREIIVRYKVLFGPEHLLTIGPSVSLSFILHKQQKWAEVEALQRELLTWWERHDGPKAGLAACLYALGEALEQQGKLDAAEDAYRQALAVGRAFLGDEHQLVQVAVSALSELFIRNQKPEKIDQLFDELHAQDEASHPPSADLLRLGSGLRARVGQWDKAAADLARVRDIHPEDHEVWYELAALLVASGQLDAYRELCRESLERFGHSSDLLALERIAKDCLILPSSGADLGVVAQMADTVAAVTNHWASPWFQLVKGLAEYRQRRYPSAVAWVNRTLSRAGMVSERDVQAYAVLAMAHEELKQTNEARAAFAVAAEIARTELPTLESGDLGGGWGWLDWIMAHTLLREAREMMGGGATASASTGDRGDPRRHRTVRRMNALHVVAEQGDVEAMNDLAWILATSGDLALRDGQRAVGLAKQAVAITGRKHPAYLDTLAAAYAEIGDFAGAAEAQSKAIALLPDGEMKNDFESRLKLYQSNTPYREP